jgi:hypothetical protein
MATEMVLVPRIRYEKMLLDDTAYKEKAERYETLIKDKGMPLNNDGDSAMDEEPTILSDTTKGVQETDQNATVESVASEGERGEQRSVSSGSQNKFLTPPPMDIVVQFAQKYQLYAKRLLAYIKRNGGNILGWDNEGHVVQHGKVMADTDIKTLIEYIFKSKGQPPKGIKTFRKALSEIRVPKGFLKPFLLKPPGIPSKVKKNWITY